VFTSLCSVTLPQLHLRACPSPRALCPTELAPSRHSIQPSPAPLLHSDLTGVQVTR
jgi:hypothetical protein